MYPSTMELHQDKAEKRPAHLVLLALLHDFSIISLENLACSRLRFYFKI